MSRLDLRKELKHLYTSTTKPNIIDVPKAKFLTITGRGEPGGEAFQSAVGSLYSIAYTVKFKAKAEGRDFTVMALEGLWWWDTPATRLAESPPREQWNWKLMLRQPDFMTGEMVKSAKKKLETKKDLKEIDRANLEGYEEGLSAQIMHIGPYSEEGPTVETLHDFIEKSGYKLRPFHHEIYLSDPRRVPPPKWKTIIRQPIEK